MGAVKKHFQEILDRHFNYVPPLNQPQPISPNQSHVHQHIPANEQHILPRRVFILTRNGEPIDAYTNEDTANYEMHLCIQGDMYDAEKNADNENYAYPENDYEVRELRLCYSTL
jgi:hypothetical protein